MEKEILHFKIGLSGTLDNKGAEFKILIDDKEMIHQQLYGSAVQYFEFDSEIDEGNHKLIVQFLNKESSDTVKNNNGEIISDLLLNIESIEIDEIDLGSLKWTHNDYVPEYPDDYEAKNSSPKIVKNCVNLGWKGSWILPFTSPYYIWLLENM